MNSISTAVRRSSYALAVALAGLSLPAVAAESQFRSNPGFYAGGGVGYDRLNGEHFTGNGNDVDDKRVTYKGLVGFRLNQIVSFEAQYIDFGTAENGGNRVKADGVTAGIVAELPLFKYANPYGKAGALHWDSDGQFGNFQRSDDGTDFTYGVGVRFGLNDRLDFRVEYERFELGRNDVDNVSALAQFNF